MGRQGVSRTRADKLKLLRLAREYGNVARACKEMGFARDSYYRLRDLYKRLGKAGLEPTSRRGRPLPKNRVEPAIEEAVVKLTRKHPEWGRERVAEEVSRGLWEKADAALREHPGWKQRRVEWSGRRARVPKDLRHLMISPTGVRGVWRRNNLITSERPAVSRPWTDPLKKPKAPAPPIRCPNCRKAAVIPPSKCPRCGIGIPPNTSRWTWTSHRTAQRGPHVSD